MESDFDKPTREGDVDVDVDASDDQDHSTCNDIFWTILFYVTVLINIIFAGFYKSPNSSDAVVSSEGADPDAVAITVGIICAIIYTLTWLWFVSKFAASIIKVNIVYLFCYINYVSAYIYIYIYIYCRHVLL